MNNRIKYLVAAAVVAATVGFAAGPASATRFSTVEAISGDLADDLADMGDAGRDVDADAMADACGSLNIDAMIALTYSRPKSLTRTAWRHMTQSWRYMRDAGALCESGAESLDAGQIAEATELLDLATDQITLATAAMR